MKKPNLDENCIKIGEKVISHPKYEWMYKYLASLQYSMKNLKYEKEPMML
jgi:hypothetical protein